ncbi:hypothetical protein VNO78_13925 [Psophocarpus tetragonolobus]|uniref:Uncharacterized protein n=1 Tax=Psophocarpus tetragonolobus TaxID=3891 RepID=A0AAN9SQM5_PSOTE
MLQYPLTGLNMLYLPISTIGLEFNDENCHSERLSLMHCFVISFLWFSVIPRLSGFVIQGKLGPVDV